MGIFIPSSRVAVGDPLSTAEMRHTHTEYRESEARALIGKTFRTKQYVFGIREGRCGRVVDVDKIRAYVSRSEPGTGGGNQLKYSVFDEWHLTIEWTEGTGRMDVFRKNEVAEYLTEVN